MIRFMLDLPGLAVKLATLARVPGGLRERRLNRRLSAGSTPCGQPPYDPPERRLLNEVTAMASSRAIDWVLLDHTAAAPVQVGDLVSVDAGGMPIYRVAGLSGSRAWLDDERRRVRRLTSLEAFRWRGGTVAA
jgi:hypothetical protein